VAKASKKPAGAGQGTSPKGATRNGAAALPAAARRGRAKGARAARGEAAGLFRGDVIEDAHGHPVHSGDQLFSVVHALPEGADVMLVGMRNGPRHEPLVHLDRG
jgi:S1-C subfamily serine protease